VPGDAFVKVFGFTDVERDRLVRGGARLDADPYRGRFEVTVGIRSSKPAVPDFRGPVVQGPLGQRFVYIDIGTYAGQTDVPWSRRLKIPLIGITWDVIDRASATQMVLETRVPGTARDGGPTCATVKPFGGWKLAR
jgi:hypothetical protein